MLIIGSTLIAEDDKEVWLCQEQPCLVLFLCSDSLRVVTALLTFCSLINSLLQHSSVGGWNTPCADNCSSHYRVVRLMSEEWFQEEKSVLVWHPLISYLVAFQMTNKHCSLWDVTLTRQAALFFIVFSQCLILGVETLLLFDYKSQVLINIAHVLEVRWGPNVF